MRIYSTEKEVLGREKGNRGGWAVFSHPGGREINSERREVEGGRASLVIAGEGSDQRRPLSILQVRGPALI